MLVERGFVVSRKWITGTFRNSTVDETPIWIPRFGGFPLSN
jgi:hypothetical protein